MLLLDMITTTTVNLKFILVNYFIKICVRKKRNAYLSISHIYSTIIHERNNRFILHKDKKYCLLHKD